MSVIVAIKEKGVIYIGADSQTTKGSTKSTLKNPNNYKIWKVGNIDNCLMGSVGAVREACVVRLIDNLVTDYNVYKNHIDYEFVVKSIVPDIVTELKKYHFLKEDNDYISGIDSSFLFAYRNQLYLIHSDLCVIEVEDYIAIGSGEAQAIGSLASTEGQSPEERIIKAINASSSSDIYVNYPIILSNTKNTKFTVFNEGDKLVNKKEKEEKPKTGENKK